MRPHFRGSALLLCIALFLPAIAAAKDAIIGDVSPNGEPVPVVVKLNGNGPNGEGTIQLWYIVTRQQLPLSFTLAMQAKANTNSPTTYGSGIDLTLGQNGSSPVTLSPDPALFKVDSSSWTGSSQVLISVDKDAAVNTDLVANLKLTAGSKLDTPTSIQVHLTLVEPAACLHLVSFASEMDLAAALQGIIVNAKAGGAINATIPGQISYNALVANTCANPFSFDMKLGLDPAFDTNPRNGHGEAVSLYTVEGQLEPGTFTLSTLSDNATKENKVEALCLGAIEVPGLSSVLVTVHSELTAPDVSALASSPFTFVTDLYQPHTTTGSSCTGGTPLPDSIVDPGPKSTFLLPYTIQYPGGASKPAGKPSK